MLIVVLSEAKNLESLRCGQLETQKLKVKMTNKNVNIVSCISESARRLLSES